jgi:hypothetical protein
VVGLSNPQRVGIQAAETSRRSDPHYGVRGGCSEVVPFGLNEVVWGFKLILSWLHDMVHFETRVSSRRGAGVGRVWVDIGYLGGCTTCGEVGSGSGGVGGPM